MKKASICCFIIFSTIQTFAQINLKNKVNYEIIYKLTYQINKEDTTAVNTENMLLQLGDTYSLFSTYNNQKIKETLMEMGKMGSVDFRKVPKSKFLYSIIKDKKNQEVLFFNRFGVTNLFYANLLNDFNWDLQTDEKIVNGYTCKKATTTFGGRDYIAWYALEIPISDGPYKFNGLPGLILEIYDIQKHYHFKLASLEKVNKQETITFENYMKVSEKQYDEHEKKIRDKPSLMAQTDKMAFPKEMLDKIDENGRKKFAYENNPIELKDTNE